MAEVDPSCSCVTRCRGFGQKLFSSAGRLHLECVQNLLNGHKDTMEEREFNFTLNRITFTMSEQGNAATMECLLKGAAAANVRIPVVRDDTKDFVETPLELAATNGHAETVSLLLKYGASVNSGRCSPLYQAVHKGFPDVVRVLLESGAEIERDHGEYLGTPLIIAVHKGNLEICEILLQFGIDPNISRDRYENLPMTPLYCAVLKRNLGAIKMLLRYGAQVHYQGKVCALETLYVIVSPTAKSDNEYFLMLKHLLIAADVRTNSNVLPQAIHFANQDYQGGCKDVTVRHMPLLYAAGFPVTDIMKDIDKYRNVIPQFILDDQNPKLPLLGLCRKQIRSYLLSSEGGDHKNLMHAVPKLPLPQILKDILLFGVEPLSLEEGDAQEREGSGNCKYHSPLP